MGQRLIGTAFDGLVELPAEHDLQSVDVYITSQCNRRCTYCFLPSDFFSSGQRMSADAYVENLAETFYLKCDSEIMRHREVLEHLREGALSPVNSARVWARNEKRRV